MDKLIDAIRQGVEDYLRRSRPYHIAVVAIPCFIAIPLVAIVVWKIASDSWDLIVLAPGGIVIFVMSFSIDQFCKINNCIGQASFLEAKLRTAKTKAQCYEIIQSLSCLNLKTSLAMIGKEDKKDD